MAYNYLIVLCYIYHAPVILPPGGFTFNAGCLLCNCVDDGALLVSSSGSLSLLLSESVSESLLDSGVIVCAASGADGHEESPARWLSDGIAGGETNGDAVPKAGALVGTEVGALGSGLGDDAGLAGVWAVAGEVVSGLAVPATCCIYSCICFW